MAKYYVTMPFAGKVKLKVEAENEDDAIDEFFKEFIRQNKNINEIGGDVDWDFYEKLLDNNNVYAYFVKVKVEKAKN